MLFLLFLSNVVSRLENRRSAPSAGTARTPVLVGAALALSLAFSGLFLSGTAAAQDDDSDLTGLQATVENTFASDELTDGEEIIFGSAGPREIGPDVEFVDCCEDFYDIDIASDRITMTWVGDDEYARTLEEGTFDRYRFTVVGATFASAEADPDRNLVPDVTFFANSISVRISEGDEVGPGQDAVILIEAVVTEQSRAEAEAAAEEEAAEEEEAEADEDDGAAATDDADDDDDEVETLPRTGLTTELIAAIGLFVLALGLITYGVGNRARRLELV